MALAASLLLVACATPPGDEPLIPAPLFKLTNSGLEVQAAAAPDARLGERRLEVHEVPPLPAAGRTSTVKPGTPRPAAGETADTTLAFDQIPLPTFIQVVFGSILKKSFSADPAVMLRNDIITLRSGTPQSPSQVFDTARMLLKSYGVAVNDMGGGFYRIVPDTNQASYQPEIRRGRAMPEVPLPLRPVFYLVEMTAVRHADVANWLKAMFGNRLNIQEAAMLVGMLKNPSLFNPKRKPEKAKQRRSVVLDQMRKNRIISREEYDSLKVLPVDLSKFRRKNHTQGLATYFRSSLARRGADERNTAQ